MKRKNSYDNVVSELEELKNLLSGSGGANEEISIGKSEESIFSDINGRESLHRQRSDEVSRDGKLFAKVSEKLDVTKDKDGKPKSVSSTKVEIPPKGIDIELKGAPNKEVDLSSLIQQKKEIDEPDSGVNISYLNDSNMNIVSPTGMRFSSLDMAEYIFWTGDERGVTMAIEEFLERGLISREVAVKFLQSIRTNIDLMVAHYQGLQKIDGKFVKKMF